MKCAVSVLAFTGLLACVACQELLEYRLEEEAPVGNYVGDIVADAMLDRVYPPSVLPNLRFRFLKPTSHFRIDEMTGVITTSARIDRDQLCPNSERCDMRVDVAVQPVQHFKIIKVMIEILDLNDNEPIFPEPQITHSMFESAQTGSAFVVIPTASDPDSPDFSVQAYNLMTTSANFELRVTEKVDGSKEVKLVLIEALDRETESEYQMKVVAYDGGSPSRSGSVDLSILVLDANDNSPRFEQAVYEVNIPENIPEHTSIIQVHATDPDDGFNGQVVYGFSERTQTAHGHLFTINNASGVVTVNGLIDFEQSPIYHLSVVAKDRGPDALPGDTTIIVRVDDVNDHKPEISVSTLSQGETGVAEIAEDAEVGTFVAHITVVDRDKGRNARFNCTLNDNQFTLKELFDSEYQIITQTVLDREKHGEYNLALVCKDNGRDPLVGIQHIRVVVADVNDHSPVFEQRSYKAELIENNYIGARVVQVNATDIDVGKNAEIVYSIPGQAASYFDIEPRTGVIKARASLDREVMDTVRFHVLAKDKGTPARSASALVSVSIQDVNDERPKFTQEKYSFGVFENEVAGTEVGAVSAVDHDSPPYNEFTYSILPIHGMSEYFIIDRITGMISNTKELDREAEREYELVVSVSDRGVPPLTSTTSVAIHVADKNDNPPEFVFPSHHNNTVYLSNLVPEGYIVTRVLARDPDLSNNAKVTYHLKSEEDSGAFEIDSMHGTITVVGDFALIDDKQFDLEITGKDSGYPQLSTTTNLYIVVNKSVNFPQADGHHMVLSGHNFTIVICLACISGLITIVLVVAIVLIRRKDQDKRTHKYNCRMEALKMLQQKGERKSSTDSQCNGGLPNGSCGEGEKAAKKEVSFNLEMEDGHPDKSRQSWPSVIDHQTLQNPQASSSLLTQQSPGGRGVKQGQGQAQGNGKPWALTQKELELLKRDGDSASLHSGEGSNTDSGRGPSEEGEGMRHNADHSNDSHGMPSHHSMSPVHEDSSMAQVVPNLPSFNSSAHSYSSRQPQKLQTFSADNDKYSPKFHDNNFNNSNNYSLHEQRAPEPLDSRRLNDGFVHATPAKVIPITPIGMGCPPPRHHRDHASLPYGNHSNVRGSDDSGTESELSEVQYTTVDMSDILRAKPHRLDTIIDDDAATTTSGSYVVDPDDLCDEIDELFFKS